MTAKTMLHQVKTFSNRHPYIGPLLWILCVQYFIAQVIVAAAWPSPHSWMVNPISDLGNTVCGVYDDRYVCSPLHVFMNASFVLLGLTVTLGSSLVYYGFRRDKRSYIGFSLMAIAGIGIIFVGLFPENTIGFMHTFGAVLPFLLGNVSMIILAFSLDIPRWMRWYTFASGLLGLFGLLFLAFQNYLGLGLGGMERVAAYPQTIWLIVFGIYVSEERFRKSNGAK